MMIYIPNPGGIGTALAFPSSRLIAFYASGDGATMFELDGAQAPILVAQPIDALRSLLTEKGLK